MVETRGFGPLTFALRLRRSTPELRPPDFLLARLLKKSAEKFFQPASLFVGVE